MEHAIDPTLVVAIRDAVGRPVRALESVEHVPLAYDPFLAGRDLQRVRGVAVTDDGAVRWSLIEKRTDGPATASAYLVDNGRREFAAYASGLLDDIAPRIRAPRAHAQEEDADGGFVLWLEDVGPGLPRPMAPRALVGVAHDLGGLAGRWLGRPPREPWMFTGWITRHSQPDAMDAGIDRMRRAAEHPSVQARIGRHLDAAVELVRAQARVATILEELPATLCHHDAVGANVMAVGDGRDASTVLIDWESIGPGPAGADLASIVFSSARRGDSDASATASLLDEAVAAYLEGMAQETDRVDARAVRRGVDGAIALRWTLIRDIALAVEQGRAPRRGSRPDEPAERALDELSILTDVLMAAARRALG